MTGRERLERLIDGLPIDRVPITTLVDDVTRSQMPPEWRDIPVLEFYRKLGYDHLQLGNDALPQELRMIPPYKIQCGFTAEQEKRGDVTVKRRTMDGRSLELHIRLGHPIKYPVNDEEELELLCRMWESVEVIEKTGAELEESIASYARLDAAIGDMGIIVPDVEPSGVQHMLEAETGVENFYYLLDDAPELTERTVEAIQRQRQSIYECLAKHFPSKTVIPVENTSTTLISPALYRKYTLPHMQKYAQTMHQYGKKAIIHMCGHLGALLPELKEIGLDGIHALTEPPVGSCTYEMALDALGENLVVFTGFDATVMRDKNKSVEEKRQLVRDTLRPRVLAGNFCFGPGADGRVTPVEYFEMVRDAVWEFGRKSEL